MRLDIRPRFPADPKLMERKLTDLFVETNTQVNRLTEGTASAVHNAGTAAPTAGTFAVGDFIRNSAPVELGAAASKYVILGWVNTVAGSPGTFLQARALIGN